jgi:medium-chain acyl-[acyl-carrier-protein] hydrolase
MITVTANRWVVRPKPNPGASMRLFCFPYAGGSASAFYTWPAHLPASIELCAVQLPGRETRMREPLFDHVAPLTGVLAETLASYFDKPFAFFGHSMGAIISFELARELRRQGQTNLKALFVSARVPPQIQVRQRPVYLMPEPELIATLRTFNGTPEVVFQDPELLGMLLPVLRADFAINECYTYSDEPPLDIPITAFGGTQDTIVDAGELGGWAQQTRGAFQLRMLAGDHFFLNTAQPQLIQAIIHNLQQKKGGV